MLHLAEKGARIREMFDTIAHRYDFLNRLLSFGIDKRWRKAAMAGIRCGRTGYILDIATGTGDMALAIAEATGYATKIVGLDFSQKMVRIAQTKVASSAYREKISLGVGSCERLPFRDEAFETVAIAFGIRNVVDRALGLSEIFRVLVPGGRVVILEFSKPRFKLIRNTYHLYLCRILPFIGSIFSDTAAYRYLPDSVLEFPNRTEFKKMMTDAGFEKTGHTDYSLGIVTVYVGDKPLTLSSHTLRP